jgi:polar amino acid transport system substrate-binding protein
VRQEGGRAEVQQPGQAPGRLQQGQLRGRPDRRPGIPGEPQAVQALLAGNVEVVAATITNLTDVVDGLTGKAEIVKDPSSPNGWLASPNGFGFLKSRTDLAEAYRAALQSLVDDGSYAKILQQWKQDAMALKQITVDKAVD